MYEGRDQKRPRSGSVYMWAVRAHEQPSSSSHGYLADAFLPAELPDKEAASALRL